MMSLTTGMMSLTTGMTSLTGERLPIMRKAVRVESNRKPTLFWKVLVLVLVPVPGVRVEREGWEVESGKDNQR